MAKTLKVKRSHSSYKKSGSKKKIIIIIIIVVVIVACGALGYLFRENIVGLFNQVTGYFNPTVSEVVSSAGTDKGTVNTDIETGTDTDTLVQSIPELNYSDTAEGYFGDDNQKVYMFDKISYEIFYGNSATAQNYAAAVKYCADSLKSTLGDSLKIYDLVAPTRAEVTLPDEYKIKSGTCSQKNNIAEVSSALPDYITSVNSIESLLTHRNEYIFYNTDSFWTARGAYYAYAEFAKAAGLEPLVLEKLEEDTNKVEGYIGANGNTVRSNTKAYKEVTGNADTVEYYDIPVSCSATLTDDVGKETSASLYYPNPSTKYAYSVFLWGSDNAYMTIKTQNTTGKKLLVVKDAAANSFVPYLAAHYDEIYVIDYRSYGKKIPASMKNKGITDVLFLNGIMDANTGVKVNYMKELF